MSAFKAEMKCTKFDFGAYSAPQTYLDLRGLLPRNGRGWVGRRGLDVGRGKVGGWGLGGA